MKNKILIFLSVVFLLLCQITPILASEKYSDAVNEIVEYEVNKAAFTDVQSFVDDGLVPYAGSSIADWYVIAISKYDNHIDFSKYKNMLDKYVDNFDGITATDYERIALVYSCIGYNKEWVQNVINEQTGKRGIISIIFSLMIASYGEYDIEITSEQIGRMLFEYQLPDGSFSVAGKRGDVDVTAMALQALAPLYNVFSEKIELAKQFLINSRNENGGYSSMGIENMESQAQALMAFCALKDKENAEKSYEYLLSHQNASGAFPHTIEDTDNEISTYQCLLALLSYERMLKNQSFVYESAEFRDVENVRTEVSRKKLEITGKIIKLILCLLAVIIYIFVLIDMLIKRKKRSSIIVITAVLIIIETALFFSKIQTKSEYYSENITGNITVSLTIKGHGEEWILKGDEIPINEFDSVFTQLKNASIIHKLTINYTGSELLNTIYISGINGLYEFDYGKMSGWTYKVNGEYPNISCSQYELKKGDIVEWIYTDDGGVE